MISIKKQLDSPWDSEASAACLSPPLTPTYLLIRSTLGSRFISVQWVLFTSKNTNMLQDLNLHRHLRSVDAPSRAGSMGEHVRETPENNPGWIVMQWKSEAMRREGRPEETAPPHRTESRALEYSRVAVWILESIGTNSGVFWGLIHAWHEDLGQPYVHATLSLCNPSQRVP